MVLAGQAAPGWGLVARGTRRALRSWESPIPPPPKQERRWGQDGVNHHAWERGRPPKALDNGIQGFLVGAGIHVPGNGAPNSRGTEAPTLRTLPDLPLASLPQAVHLKPL